MREIANFIQTVGFPIFVAVYLLYFYKSLLIKLLEILDEIKISLQEINGTSKEVKKQMATVAEKIDRLAHQGIGGK
jgi:hypothetical protein